MNIELTTTEIRDIDAALEARLREMQVELIHTDQRELREDLRENLVRLEEVARRVHSLADTAPWPQEVGHTLATGRPGSSRPLAEANPDRAQSQSVVATTNPHADSKISSAGASKPGR